MADITTPIEVLEFARAALVDAEAGKLQDGAGTAVVQMIDRSNTCALERQESIVSTLWKFAKRQQIEPHDVRQDNGTTVSINALDEALNAILETFGQKRIELQ